MMIATNCYQLHKDKRQPLHCLLSQSHFSLIAQLQLPILIFLAKINPHTSNDDSYFQQAFMIVYLL